MRDNCSNFYNSNANQCKARGKLKHILQIQVALVSGSSRTCVFNDLLHQKYQPSVQRFLCGLEMVSCHPVIFCAHTILMIYDGDGKRRDRAPLTNLSPIQFMISESWNGLEALIPNNNSNESSQCISCLHVSQHKNHRRILSSRAIAKCVFYRFCCQDNKVNLNSCPIQTSARRGCLGEQKPKHAEITSSPPAFFEIFTFQRIQEN